MHEVYIGTVNDGSMLLGALALAVPLVYGLGATSVRRASLAGVLGLGLALTVIVGWLVLDYGRTTVVGLQWPGTSLLAATVRLDAATCAMLGLVTLLACIVVRFSRTYLSGERGRGRYFRWLMITLACVALLVVSNDLLVIAVAWVGTSLSLHQLLTFYRDRTAALVAAHKKFLVSRMADVCLWTGMGLLAVRVGSLELDAIAAWAEATPDRPLDLEIAAVLLVIGAALKSAQLPFHGWLTQVMEAPTPVSALLHAGVVNLGGFLMIRLAPFMSGAELAQTLLVMIGAGTSVVAALVMSTSPSIKVRLAWSTCAQMGLMLVQCGLGAYHLALLHLVAHSLYKAHAFLSSGSTVEAWRARSLLVVERRIGGQAWLAATLVAALVVYGVGRFEAVASAFTIPLVLGLAPLVARGMAGGRSRVVPVVLASAVVAGATFALHAAVQNVLEVPTTGMQPWRVAIVLASFGALFGLQAILRAYPRGAVARALVPRLSAGLHLDDIFTRLTFRWWPPRLPAHPTHVRPLAPMEARS